MNSIVEKKKYTHLNHKERWIIAELRYQKKSIRFIATRLASGDVSHQFGHWEIDQVGSSSNATVVALVEKKSKYVLFHKVPNKKSETMKYAILFLFRNIPQSLRKSITYDIRVCNIHEHANTLFNKINGICYGSENVLHHEVNTEIGTSSYF